MKIALAILIMLHGLIVAAQSSVSFKPLGGTPNPTWMKWFPLNLGQSWLLAVLKAENSVGGKALGVLWLAAGLTLLLAGFGLLHFLIPFAWWKTLALVGAALSLLLLGLYFHPLYLVGVAASLLLLLALVLKSWPVLQQIGL